MHQQNIKDFALWVMEQYELTTTRQMYASLQKKEMSDFKTWRDSFFFWLVGQTTSDKEVRSEVISTISKLRMEQKALIREAIEHEQELTHGLPEDEK